MSTLYVRDGSGYRIARATDIIERAESLLAQRFRSGSPVLGSPSLTHAFLRTHLAGREFETFGILHLDQRHRLIAAEDLFRGTINGAAVHPREVVKSVIAHNSAAALLYHNHPSGCPTPSQADELITRRVQEALALIDVRVLDHLIVAESVYSFAEAGLI